jgi:hypothetical protein
MSNQHEKNQEIMRELWQNEDLSDLEANPSTFEGNHFAHGSGFHKARMLREINHDNDTPKRHDFVVQNELHEKIRNDEDYDDWDYGTEPTYGKKWENNLE